MTFFQSVDDSPCGAGICESSGATTSDSTTSVSTGAEMTTSITACLAVASCAMLNARMGACTDEDCASECCAAAGDAATALLNGYIGCIVDVCTLPNTGRVCPGLARPLAGSDNLVGCVGVGLDSWPS